MEVGLYQVLRVMVIVGGMTGRSIFPKVEKLLEKEEYLLALVFVTSSRRAGRYRSVMDFFFCCLFPKWEASCQRFYRGEGPQLRELIGREERLNYERKMVLALHVALEMHQVGGRTNWCKFKKAWKEAMENQTGR